MLSNLMRYSTIRTAFVALLAVGLLGLTACDQTIEKTPEQDIPPDQVFSDVAGAEAALNAAYDGLQQNGVFGGFPVMAADFTADNAIFSGSFTTWNNAENFNVTAEHGPTENIWTDHYDAINRANLVIDNAGDVPNISDAKANQLVGEAKFMRALLYFNLVRWFAEPYEPGAQNDQPSVILQTSAVESTDPEFNKPRSTVDSVYTQITNDLSDAAGNLSVNDNAKRVGQAGVNALRAKVALYQGRWDDAASLAQDVIDTDAYSLSDAPITPYQNEQSSEIVFAVSFSSIDNTDVNAFPTSFYLPEALGGRGDANPPAGFIGGAESGDVRADSSGAYNGSTLLYTEGGNIWTNKWTDPNLGDDYPVLRVAEMHLIRAEGLARGSGSASDARTHVNMIRNRAGLGDVGSDLSGQELIDEIIRQRKYELAFEADRRHDLQRLGRTINSGSGSVSPGDPQRILPIPQRAIDVNGALTEESQNPGY